MSTSIVDRFSHYGSIQGDYVPTKWIADFEFLGSDKKKKKHVYSHKFSLEQPLFAYTDYHQAWNMVVSSMSVVNYFEKVTRDYSSISMNKEIVGGMPVVKGTRIPVALIISCLSEGMTIEEISEDFGLKENEVRESLNYVVDLLNRPFHEGNDETLP